MKMTAILGSRNPQGWTTRKIMRMCWAVLVAVLLSSRAVAAADTASMAREAVLSSGVNTGLVVHVGCGDGKLTVELARAGKFLVQGLAADVADVRRARETILSRKLYGLVSAKRAAPGKLPYVDDLVNLLVVHNAGAPLASGLSADEVARVLCPGGVAVVGAGNGELAAKLAAAGLDAAGAAEPGAWASFVKPRPKEMGQWSHVRHGADGNPVSTDTLVGPIASLRWIHGPIWRGGLAGRADVSGSSLTAGGRNLYAEGTVRDSYNGLFVREASYPQGRTIADGDRIYAGGDGGFVQAIDSATGKTILTYKEIRNPQRNAMVLAGGDLVFANGGGIASVKAETGKLNWRDKLAKGFEAVLVGDGRVFAQASDRRGGNANVICLDLATGNRLWTAGAKDIQGRMHFCKYGVLTTWALGKGAWVVLHAYSAEDGRELWHTTDPIPTKGRNIGTLRATGIYGVDGLVWVVPIYRSKIRGFDPRTGVVRKTYAFTPGEGQVSFQCSEGSSTTRFLMGGRPIVFVDVKTGKRQWNRVARNGCGGAPGLLFGNGLLYGFPKECECFEMLRGYSAFSASPATHTPAKTPPLEKGPAYGRAGSGGDKAGSGQDWPMYRNDPRRSASTGMKVPLPLAEIWNVEAEDQPVPDWLAADWRNNPSAAGRISAPVVGGGLVVVALRNSHRVAAFDAGTGRLRWSHAAGGRVAMPPAIADGWCVFGAQDGWVYCLRLADGKLAWRLRAAPGGRDIVAFGQLENHWPISGGVLVEDGRVYVVAGRSSELKAGLVGYVLDIATGKVLHRVTPPPTEMPRYKRPACGNVRGIAYMPDLPVSAGAAVQMAHGGWAIDKRTGKTVASPSNTLRSSRDGLIDFMWATQGPVNKSSINQVYGKASGELIAFGAQRAFVFHQAKRQFYNENGVVKTRTVPAGFYAIDRAAEVLQTWPRWAKAKAWTQPVPEGVLIRAMIVAGETLWAGGAKPGQGKAGKGEGVIVAMSTEDGSKLAECVVAEPPAVEGMAAAYGRLYVATRGGRLLCLGKK